MRRFEQLEHINNYLSGINLVLKDFNETDRFPSVNLSKAKGYIAQAQKEIEREISNLKKINK